MKKILAILVSFLVLAAPAMAATETGETLPVEPGLTPDSWTYGLDKAMERIQLALTRDEVKRAELRYKIAEERLAEANEMIAKEKPEFANDLVDEYEAELDETNKEMEKAVALGKDVTDLTERVAARTARHLEVLQGVYEKVPEQAKSAILHAIEMSSKHSVDVVSHIENGEEYREKIRAEVKERGIDKGEISNAIGEITRARDNTDSPVEVEVETEEIENEEGEITGEIIMEDGTIEIIEDIEVITPVQKQNNEE